MSTTRTHRSAGAAAILVALFAIAVPGAAPAGAGDATSAVCVTTFQATIAPGFTMTPAAGKLTSRGQTGSLDCFGTIDNQRITGVGTMGFVERHASGTCRGHVGTGRVHLVIPTAAGNKDLVGRLSVRRTGLTVRVKVRFPGARFSGSGVIFPMGDCAAAPLERIKVTITGALVQT